MSGYLHDKLGWGWDLIGKPTSTFAIEAEPDVSDLVAESLDRTGHAEATFPLRSVSGEIHVARMRFSRRESQSGVWRTFAYVLELFPDRREKERPIGGRAMKSGTDD